MAGKISLIIFPIPVFAFKYTCAFGETRNIPPLLQSQEAERIRFSDPVRPSPDISGRICSEGAQILRPFGGNNLILLCRKVSGRFTVVSKKFLLL